MGGILIKRLCKVDVVKLKKRNKFLLPAAIRFISQFCHSHLLYNDQTLRKYNITLLRITPLLLFWNLIRFRNGFSDFQFGSAKKTSVCQMIRRCRPWPTGFNTWCSSIILRCLCAMERDVYVCCRLEFRLLDENINQHVKTGHKIGG